MSLILRSFNWCLCLGLRCNAYLSNRAHEKLKSGPQARLWAASDHELMAECKRRGLLRRRPKTVTEVPQTQTVRIEEHELVLAVKTVATLQQMKESVAEKLVRKAISQWSGPAKPSADQIAALVLKPVNA